MRRTIKKRCVQVLCLPLILVMALVIGGLLVFLYAIDGKWDDVAVKQVKDMWRRMKK